MAEPNVPVVNIMNGVLLHADVGENLQYLTELLIENNAHAVLVREKGMPVGIVTSKDILRTLIQVGGDPEKIKAKTVMTAPLVAVSYDDNPGKARELMIEHNIKKLPVQKDFDVIGLLVQDDLIRDMSWTNY